MAVSLSCGLRLCGTGFCASVRQIGGGFSIQESIEVSRVSIGFHGYPSSRSSFLRISCCAPANLLHSRGGNSFPARPMPAWDRYFPLPQLALDLDLSPTSRAPAAWPKGPLDAFSAKVTSSQAASSGVTARDLHIPCSPVFRRFSLFSLAHAANNFAPSSDRDNEANHLSTPPTPP